MLAQLLQLSLLALLLLFPLVSLIRRRASSSPDSRLPPSPPKLPFIGNLHQVGALPHRSLHALAKKHGNLMFLYLGRVPTLVASSADEAREITRTHDLSFASRPSLELPNLLFAGGMDLVFAPYSEHWRQMRKVCLTHLLSARMVESFRLMREEEVGRLTEKISRASSGAGAVDVSEALYFFTNDVLCRAVSGKPSSEKGQSDLFRELIEENSALAGAFHVGDYLPSLGWLDVFFGLRSRARRNGERWVDVLDKVIEEHASRSRSGEIDFVDVLLSLQKDPDMDFTLTGEHMKPLLQDMFAAGTDTSFITLDWAMAELVRNPEAMKKLQHEVRGVARGNDKIKEEDLSGMSYLKLVIKEVLRLHPPVPLLVPRESLQDCQIGVYRVPKQTRVIINAWAIGRDPRFWEAAEEFRPERFIGSPADFKGNDFHFIPFGAGRRICPGMKFAVATTELALANLVNQFDWELPDGLAGENMDMDEAPGLTSRRKQKLHLDAKPHY